MVNIINKLNNLDIWFSNVFKEDKTLKLLIKNDKRHIINLEHGHDHFDSNEDQSNDDSLVSESCLEDYSEKDKDIQDSPRIGTINRSKTLGVSEVNKISLSPIAKKEKDTNFIALYSSGATG